MKELTLFVMRGCPHCRMAQQFTEELCREDPRLRQIPIRQIDENEQPELANRYDYYYVPCYFMGRKNCTRGAAPRSRSERCSIPPLKAEKSEINSRFAPGRC